MISLLSTPFEIEAEPSIFIMVFYPPLWYVIPLRLLKNKFYLGPYNTCRPITEHQTMRRNEVDCFSQCTSEVHQNLLSKDICFINRRTMFVEIRIYFLTLSGFKCLSLNYGCIWTMKLESVYWYLLRKLGRVERRVFKHIYDDEIPSTQIDFFRVVTQFVRTFFTRLSCTVNTHSNICFVQRVL